MRKLPLFLALLLMGCKAVKPAPVDSLKAHQTLLALEQLQRETLTPTKAPFLHRLFGAGKVKVKGTVAINVQNASNGSTIGANTQSGTDASKTKESATSTAKTANTGGQNAGVDGDASAPATNTPKDNLLKWVLLAAAGGFLLRHFGPVLWGLGMRLIRPV